MPTALRNEGSFFWSFRITSEQKEFQHVQAVGGEPGNLISKVICLLRSTGGIVILNLIP